MKLGNYAGVALLASLGICTSALADTSSMDSLMAPNAPAKTKHVAAHPHPAASGALSRCIQENTADAENFCQINQSQCAAEKAGVRGECEAELRGERRSG